MRALLLMAVVLVLAAPASQAQVVKCTGNASVEYGRDCPPGTVEQKVDVRTQAATPAATPASPAAPGAPAAASQEPKSLADRDADFKKRMIEQQQAQEKEEKKSAQDEQYRQACEIAQSELKSLEVGNRVARIDPKTGERTLLEDTEVEAAMTRARAKVTENCK